jgi:RimJ/RimL family protein N-acetyltransferase
MSRIDTERLTLRRFVPTDWEAVNAFLSDPETTRYMHFASYTRADRKRWFDWCLENNENTDSDACNWAIVLRETHEVIGWLGIGSTDHPPTPGERDFGYALDRRYWNRGYMTEALYAVLRYEFEQLDAQCISATCETANIGSARVMEKVGMKWEGTFYDADFEGNWANRHRYTVSRKTFKPLLGPHA